MKWAGEGKSHADSILVNLGMNNVEAAKTSITPLGAHLRIVPRQVSRTHGRRNVPDQDWPG